jgi:hypothetical protein
MEDYVQRIWLHENITDAKNGGQRVNVPTFGMDLLPYVRTISPHHHINTVFCLESMFGPQSTNATALSHSNHTSATVHQDDDVLELWKEQEELLKEDDIVDDLENDEEW